ncbi:MAG TPA: hypothetical protein VGU43_02995 [Thermoplasmata archaeon]|nr:hypothetical protein [Thermoplasmata archaeon]
MKRGSARLAAGASGTTLLLVLLLLLGTAAGAPGAGAAASAGSSPFVVVVSGVSNLTLGDSGTFEASVSGGTGPYVYHWNEPGPVRSSGATSNLTFTPTDDRIYDLNVTVTDAVANATAVAHLFVSVQGPSPITVTLHPTGAGPTALHLTATPSGGVPPYRYAWFGPHQNGSWGTNPTASFGNLSAGTYRVTVIAQDSRGFNGSGAINLEITNPPTLPAWLPYFYVVSGVGLGLMLTVFLLMYRKRRASRPLRAG